MRTHPFLPCLALALVVAGTILLTQPQTATAAIFVQHGEFASGVPYFPGAAINFKNYTQYQDRFDAALEGNDDFPVSGWNNSIRIYGWNEVTP